MDTLKSIGIGISVIVRRFESSNSKERRAHPIFVTTQVSKDIWMRNTKDYKFNFSSKVTTSCLYSKKLLFQKIRK
jgi:hypothetical protein